MDNRIVGAQRCAFKNRIACARAVDYGRRVCLFRTPSEGDGAGRSGFNQPSGRGLRGGQIGFGQMPRRGA
ncbi:hypothetical protein BN1095_5060001 [Clostridioides difficile]|uniref:Uncharacterized protein n=1 Tax=Clostridioides difficile TaxID=1496 RepID=A0A069ARY0_CLODI|nr:hypothetical protein BN1095_5060001 [Clostridioides difficile]